MLQGAGLGLMFVPLSTITFSTLPASFRTQGTALYSLVRNIGSSIGISLVIFLLTRNTQVVHAELAGHVTPFNDALHLPEVARIWNMATVAGRAALDAEVTRQAAIVAYADDFKLMMIVALLALPLVLLLKPAKPRAGEAAVLE
jgi:DHA2 family multidrug resistance protein